MAEIFGLLLDMRRSASRTDSRASPRQTRALALTLLFLFGSGSSVHAQDATPRVEFHVGYAFLRDLGEDARNLPLGWSASVAWNPGRSVGLVLDIGGNYRSEGEDYFHQHAVLAGLRYSVRGTLTPYLEALAGAVGGRVRIGSVSLSSTDFAVQGGTGLGLRLGDRLSIRVGVDFRNIFSEGESFHELRGVAGLSFGFGGSSAAQQSALPAPSLPPPTYAPVVEPKALSRPAPSPTPPPTARVTASDPVVLPQPVDALELGHALLRGGDYARAADAFRDYLQHRATSRYTIAIGLFCDPSTAVAAAQDAGGAQSLILLVAPYHGHDCYRAYWGLYDTFFAAEQARSAVPAALRTPGQAPLPVPRLLR
jgi:hypothetical protein